MIVGVIIVLAVVSFFWALWALRKELKKPREIEHAERDLKREKVLYRAH